MKIIKVTDETYDRVTEKWDTVDRNHMVSELTEWSTEDLQIALDTVIQGAIEAETEDPAFYGSQHHEVLMSYHKDRETIIAELESREAETEVSCVDANHKGNPG